MRGEKIKLASAMFAGVMPEPGDPEAPDPAVQPLDRPYLIQRRGAWRSGVRAKPQRSNFPDGAAKRTAFCGFGWN